MPCNRDELGPKSSSCVNLPSCSGPALSQHRLLLLAAGLGSLWVGETPPGRGELKVGSPWMEETPPGRGELRVGSPWMEETPSCRGELKVESLWVREPLLAEESSGLGPFGAGNPSCRGVGSPWIKETLPGREELRFGSSRSREPLLAEESSGFGLLLAGQGSSGLDPLGLESFSWQRGAQGWIPLDLGTPPAPCPGHVELGGSHTSQPYPSLSRFTHPDAFLFPK